MQNDLIMLVGKISKTKKEGFILFFPNNGMCENQYVKVSNTLRDIPYDKDNVKAFFSVVGRIGMNSFNQPCQFFAPSELLAFECSSK